LRQDQIGACAGQGYGSADLTQNVIQTRQLTLNVEFDGSNPVIAER
jgi:hypothetical protein